MPSLAVLVQLLERGPAAQLYSGGACRVPRVGLLGQTSRAKAVFCSFGGGTDRVSLRCLDARACRVHQGGLYAVAVQPGQAGPPAAPTFMFMLARRGGGNKLAKQVFGKFWSVGVSHLPELECVLIQGTTVVSGICTKAFVARRMSSKALAS